MLQAIIRQAPLSVRDILMRLAAILLISAILFGLIDHFLPTDLSVSQEENKQGQSSGQRLSMSQAPELFAC